MTTGKFDLKIVSCNNITKVIESKIYKFVKIVQEPTNLVILI